MPPTINDILIATARRLKVRAIREGAKEYAAVLAQIKAEDVAVLITAKRPLHDILPRRVMTHPMARRIIGEDPDVLLEVLEEHNPKLARLLSTPAGRQWWGISSRGT